MAVYEKQSIPPHLHSKMKLLAQQRNKPIIREYEAAVESWIAQENQNIILADSLLETFLNERITKMEDRLAALSARIGMDVSIVLIAVFHSLSKRYGIKEEDLFEEFRPVAAKYFSRKQQTNKKG